MEQRSFTSKRKELGFDIDGESFKCVAPPGGLFLDFARMTEDPNVTEGEMSQVLHDIFSASMETADFDRFWELCRTTLSFETMMEIVAWLASAAGERPTVRSSRSAPGPRRTKAGAGSSGPVRALGNSVSENAAT